MRKLILIIAMTLLVSNAYTQTSLRIVNVDKSKFPQMKVEFYAKDAANKDYRTFPPGDFKILENGKVKPTVVTCNDDYKFSLILTIDKTASMLTNVDGSQTKPWRSDIAKAAAIRFVKAIPGFPDDPKADIALTAFASGTRQIVGGREYFPHDILKWYTFDKDSVEREINQIQFGQATNYNVAFLGYDDKSAGNRDVMGIIELATYAKYKPVVVFLTDGEHVSSAQPNPGNVRTSEIITKAKEAGIEIYCITLGLPVPQELQDIASQTGGQSFSNASTEDEIFGIYDLILQRVAASGSSRTPCFATWTADCDAGINSFAGITAPFAASSTFTYVPDKTLLPFVEFNPPTINLINNNSLSTESNGSVIITARNGNIEISDTSFSQSNFLVTDWGGTSPTFTLNKDQSRTLNVRYSSTSQNFQNSKLSFVSTDCSNKTLDINAGFAFARDINCGASTVNVEKKAIYNQKFVNRSGGKLKVSNLQISGDNDGVFNITQLLPPNDEIADNAEINLEVSFKPIDVTSKTATYTVVTDRGSFSALLSGGGSGLPDIQANSSISLPNTNCVNTSSSNTLTITNPGALELDVTSVTIDNNAFTVQGATSFKVAANGGTYPLVLRFNSTQDGNTTGKVTINSNADKKNSIQIDISAKRDKISLSTSSNTIVNFGVVCLNGNDKQTINISNTGDISTSYTISSSSADVIVSKTSGNLALLGSESFEITLNQTQEKTINSNVEITDDCGKKITFTVNAIVEKTDLVGGPFVYNATIGNPESKSIKIDNNKSRDINVTSVKFLDASGNTLNDFTASVTQFSVTSKQSYNLPVTYNPTTTNASIGFVILEGTIPCPFSSTLSITGAPGLATATLEASKGNKALVGATVKIPFTVKDKIKLFESNSKSIIFDLSLDKDMLIPSGSTPVGTINGNKRIIKYSHTLSNDNNNETFTLDFIAGTSSNKTTTIEILTNSAVTDNSAAVITPINGDFELIIPSVNLQLTKAEDFTQEPGKDVDLNIELDDPSDALRALNEGFSATVRFNRYLLEPRGYSATYSNDFGIIQIIERLPNLPTEANRKDNSLNANKYLLKKVTFRALLGNKEADTVYVENVTPLKGQVVVPSNNVIFKLKGLCNEGGLRLYDPTKQAFAITSISPSPSSEVLNIEFNVLEKGSHSMQIINALGEVVFNGFVKDFTAGNYTESFDIKNLSAGTYQIILTSPTEVRNQLIQVIR